MKLLKQLTSEEQDKLIELLFDYEKSYSSWGGLMSIYGMASGTRIESGDLKDMVVKNNIDGIRALIHNTIKKELEQKNIKTTKLLEKGH